MIESNIKGKMRRSSSAAPVQIGGHSFASGGNIEDALRAVYAAVADLAREVDTLSNEVKRLKASVRRL
jgi:hypothetical protein